MHKLRDRVERIQYMGNDATPVRAARVSFAKDTEMIWDEELQTFRLKKADKRLLNYLAGDGHWTPFGHTAITLRISMPIYIARQWFKHQIGFVYNEVSRRYVDDTPEFEFGIPWRHRPDASIKQGSGDVFDNGKQIYLNQRYVGAMVEARDVYDEFISAGVAPEQARKVLPFSTYTEFWQTGNVESFARLCHLRLDGHAQSETREYAEAVSEIMAETYPEAWEAKMKDHRDEGDVELLRQQIAELILELEDTKAQLSRYEW